LDSCRRLEKTIGRYVLVNSERVAYVNDWNLMLIVRRSSWVEAALISELVPGVRDSWVV